MCQELAEKRDELEEIREAAEAETSQLLISNQQLQLKVASLEQEIFGLTSKRPMFDSIIDNDERTKFYTGLPSYNLFSALLEYIQPKVATSDTSESVPH